jgi:hypothetical protein
LKKREVRREETGKKERDVRSEETGEKERETRRERAPLVRYDIFRLYPSRAQSGIKQGPPHGLHEYLAKNRRQEYVSI